MKKFLILLFFIPLAARSMPADTNLFSYVSLKVGNSWMYSTYGPMSNERFKLTVTGTSLQNNHVYYVLERRSSYGPVTTIYKRIDSSSADYLQKSTNSSCSYNNESLIDSLQSRLNDSCKCNQIVCADTGTAMVFNTSRKIKKFSWFSGFELGEYHYYAKNIGLYYSFGFGGVGSGTSISLVGCVINGILYGDTSLVSINQVSSEIPEKFSLSQNYPNPFNPSAKIKFDIPSVGTGLRTVRLIIYDILGKEVKILVNESLKPGSYEIDWNASNYPSGVYYYSLSADDFNETKKMVLIK